MILYHYELSPFSAKIRAMLGHAGLDWQSVIVRSLPPRPEISDLVGGYRKIPVAQIGADLFCDSRVIAAEIARLSGQPLLDLANCDADVQAYVAHTDVKIFMNCIMLTGTWAMAKSAWRGMSLGEMAGFVRDRVQIGRTSRVRAGHPRHARDRVLAHLAAGEARLAAHPWLFGEQACHADFSTWHSLWFIHDLAGVDLIKDFPRMQAWMDRLRAAGQGRRVEISAAEARHQALSATPRGLAPEHLADSRIGHRVRVAPDDYAMDPTEGVLAGVTPSRWVLARQTPEGHTVHVHFPRTGYELREV